MRVGFEAMKRWWKWAWALAAAYGAIWSVTRLKPWRDGGSLDYVVGWSLLAGIAGAVFGVVVLFVLAGVLDGVFHHRGRMR